MTTLTTTSPFTPQTSQDLKGRRLINLFKSVYNEAKLDNVRAKLLNERGQELGNGITKLIAELAISNQYVDEELRSSCIYPETYKGPKPIVKQIKAIAKIFELNPASALEYAKSLPELPNSAEGWFAIPSVDALAAKHFPGVIDSAQRYCQAVKLAHSKTASFRQFENDGVAQITPVSLRVHARTSYALDLITETQKGDILIVAAQLGLRHRGRSARRAREVFQANEFGLSSLAAHSILLVHPERLFYHEGLHMGCLGDELAPGGDGDFSHVPFIFLSDDVRVKFSDIYKGACDWHYGPSSAFLPL